MSGATPPAARSRPRADFLVEIGTEELPPKSLRALECAFAEGLAARLRDAALGFSAVESFATPRRLALRVRGLSLRQPDRQLRRRGPPRVVSFDAQGAPTRAALAFAASCGVAWQALGSERDERGQEYLCYEGPRSGEAAAGLLPGLVQSALDALPIARRMRWGALDAQFVRPVHWLLMLLGGEVVPASLFGLSAQRATRGHRFMAPRPIRIRSAAGYAAALRRGRVLAAFAERRQRVLGQVQSLAAALSCRAILSDALIDEVTALVEWPVALAGRFEPRFLSLPRELLLATLQDHQRFFALEDASGALQPGFIAVSNIDSPAPELIRAGNERVVRPRLADAEFFWQQDRRQPLGAWLARLGEVTFQAQLGSQAARTERLVALAAQIAHGVGADPVAAARAANLCKCDLASALVGEFPELQGVMGRYYALADGEEPGVATAIGEHYLPRGAGDALPGSGLGDALALADRIDLLAGIFAIGEKPSGTRDPFGLRRAAIGVLRIVLEHRRELDLPALIARAVAAQPLAGIEGCSAALAAEIYDFVLERARAHYLEGGGSGAITTEQFDAVLAVRPSSLLDFDARLRALNAFTVRPEAASLATAHKRIANILRKSAPASAPPAAIDVAALRDPAEQALHRALDAVRAPVGELLSARHYAQALDRLAALRPMVDEFFERVRVNDPDPLLRENRLSLLAQLRALFGGIADLSRLPG